MRRCILIVLVALSTVAGMGCTGGTAESPGAMTPAATTSAAPAPTPAESPSTPVAVAQTVRVPDAVAALANYAFNPSYEENPEAAAAQVKAFIAGYLRASGLEPDVRLQSVAVPDSQDPAPGSLVSPGTVVHVKIGFGD